MTNACVIRDEYRQKLDQNIVDGK